MQGFPQSKEPQHVFPQDGNDDTLVTAKGVTCGHKTQALGKGLKRNNGGNKQG